MCASIGNWPVWRRQIVANNRDPQGLAQEPDWQVVGESLKWSLDLTWFCLLSSEPFLFPLRDILQVLQVKFIDLTGSGSFLSDILI